MAQRPKVLQGRNGKNQSFLALFSDALHGKHSGNAIKIILITKMAFHQERGIWKSQFFSYLITQSSISNFKKKKKRKKLRHEEKRFCPKCKYTQSSRTSVLLGSEMDLKKTILEVAEKGRKSLY